MAMPFAGRIQGLVFCSGSSAAGNALEIYNSTTSTIIHDQSVVAAGVASARVTPDSFSGGASGASRNFSKGDVLQIRATTAGTGMTNTQVLLVVNSTDHFNDDPRRDWFTKAALDHPATTGFTNRRYRTTLSGPVSGGYAMIPFTKATLGAGETATPVASIIAPFDMTLEYANVYTGAITGTPDFDFYNNTQSALLFAAQASTASDWTMWNYDDTWTTPQVSRGDEIQLRGTTAGGEAQADLTGFLIGRVTGHANSHPRWD
jgi:hypothetical protein